MVGRGGGVFAVLGGTALSGLVSLIVLTSRAIGFEEYLQNHYSITEWHEPEPQILPPLSSGARRVMSADGRQMAVWVGTKTISQEDGDIILTGKQVTAMRQQYRERRGTGQQEITRDGSSISTAEFPRVIEALEEAGWLYKERKQYTPFGVFRLFDNE